LNRRVSMNHFDAEASTRDFERSALASELAATGFTDVVFRDCHHIVRDGVNYPLFLAICRLARVDDRPEVKS